MAMAILRSHDCLKTQFQFQFGGPRCLNSSPISIHNPNARSNNHNTNQAGFRCRRRKRSPAEGNNRAQRRAESQSTSPLVMGKVKILKRGEEIKPKMFSDGFDLVIDPIGPDPETLRREIRVPSDLYAGLSSPDPSSLPFPSGLVRRTAAANASAETDLKKLLKI